MPRFTAKILKALNTRPWARGVLIGIGNGATETSQRVVTVEVMVNTGVNVSTANLVGLLASKSSSEVSYYLVTLK